MISDYFFLAFKSFRKRGLRSWLTILGIFIGIAAVVSLISLGAGLKTAVMGQFGSLSIDTLTIQNKQTGFAPPGSAVVEKLNDNDKKIIEDAQGVKIVIPRLLRVAQFEYNKASTFNYIVSLPDNKEKLLIGYEAMGFEIKEGKLLEEGEIGKILIGKNIAEGKDFDKEIFVGKNLKINGKDFEVAGILGTTMNFQLNNVVFMFEEDMNKLLGIEGEYDLIVAQVEDSDDLEEIAKRIEEKLRQDRKEKIGEESFSVETPLQAFSAVNTILNVINLIVVGIAMISLFVGGVGIANTMYTSVLERRKEIGVLKAIGAQNKDILGIFLIESGLLGLVGGIIGALIGLGAAIGISNIANSALGENLFSVAISYPLLFGAIGFSFVVGVISGVLPALQASKLNVVEALRN
jgi:putative ABC transport system permease protein